MKPLKTMSLAILITALINPCLHSAGVAVVAVDPNAPGAMIQDNYVVRLWQLHGGDPALIDLDPNDTGHLPVLGPVPDDPNAWDVPCGPWRRRGAWEDPEGMPVSVSLLASDLEGVEVTTAPDGSWTLTVPFVRSGWHYARVRATDVPPPQSETPQTRDVEIWFRGIEGPNRQPVVR